MYACPKPTLALAKIQEPVSFGIGKREFQHANAHIRKEGGLRRLLS